MRTSMVKELPKDQADELAKELKEAKFTTAQIEELKDEETGEVKKVFVVSDESVDRDGEVISIDGWQLENFKRNPVMLWSHDPYTVALGKWENIRYRTVNGKKKLTMEPNFHKLSDMSKLISELVDKGYPPQTTSVGFRAFERDGNKFTKQELLEASFVNIPANPEATQMALTRGYDRELVGKVFDIKPEELEDKKEDVADEPTVKYVTIEQFESLSKQIKDLEVAIKAKPVQEPVSRPVKGRSNQSQGDKAHRLIQLANKALDEYLRQRKLK